MPDAVRDTVRRYWERRAPRFDDGRSKGLHSEEQRTAWETAVTGWAGGDGPLDVLDVGCGTGFLALLLAGLGHRATGVDLAGDMVRLGHTKRDGRPAAFVQSDAEGLPFRDAAFDLVVERFTLWTLPSPRAALLEWARVLRPGGRVVLVEGEWREVAHHADYQDIRDGLPLYGGLPAAGMAAVVADSGAFEEIDVQPMDDPVLWGGAKSRERYAVHARRANRP